MLKLTSSQVLKNRNSSLDIGTFARRVGLASSALRYYERIGLMEPADRRNGRRRYPAAALERVALIRLCQESGFKLAEIRELLARNRQDTWVRLAERKVHELEERITEAERAKYMLLHALQCPSSNLLDCPNFRRELAARVVNSA